MVYNDRTDRSSFRYLYWKKTMQLISSIAKPTSWGLLYFVD